MAHIQEFLAFKELHESGKIMPDAILVPWISFDMLAGSHIPKEFLTHDDFSDTAIVTAIEHKHYH